MITISIEKKLNAASGPMLLQLQCQLESGAFATLYGKSGAGKTSILRILAGLLPPEKGQIVVNGSTWLDTEKGINLPPQKRKVGFVFQDYALFPNMTVQENLCFALEKGQDQGIIKNLVEMMELGELQFRKPTTLSGGQKQRVALARALVQKPDLLLLDEPLSALDQEMRQKLQQYILQVHQEYNFTALLVSHDKSEILKMSNNLLVLEAGKLVQEGNPLEVFGVAAPELGQVQFRAELLAIENNGSICTLTVLLGEGLAKITLPQAELPLLKLGDQLQVSCQSASTQIVKL